MANPVVPCVIGVLGACACIACCDEVRPRVAGFLASVWRCISSIQFGLIPRIAFIAISLIVELDAVVCLVFVSVHVVETFVDSLPTLTSLGLLLCGSVAVIECISLFLCIYALHGAAMWLFDRLMWPRVQIEPSAPPLPPSYS